MKLQDMPPHPWLPGKHVDPATGILPICEWGAECGRGFISEERFGDGPVIRRTSRRKTRKWYALRKEHGYEHS